jgi:hypothetical protein
MSKRPISFGNSGVGSRPNPFARPSRPVSAKPALGFDNDEDASDEGNTGPPKRKQLKLDDELEEDNEVPMKSDPKPSNSSTPFFMRKPAGRTGSDDDDEDAFSRLKSKQGKREKPFGIYLG